MPLDDDSPRVVLSVPCPLCGAAAEPDPACAHCGGSGIELRRVLPDEAVRSRTAGKPPRPLPGSTRKEP